MTQVLDPIELELLRSRIETVTEQAALAVEQTAVSPVITEGRDYSVTLLDADGAVVIGTGLVRSHFGAASHAVKATIERHGDTIADGDVFVANDPHSGGGLHPQDVMVHQPIHVGGERIAWVGVSAHLMDVGGMTVGSFAPDATECYQEALRLPSVRLFRAGELVSEVWDIFRTNVRMADLVEMDLRSLVAAAHLAHDRMGPVVERVGVEPFRASLAAIRELTGEEMRRRIGAIADGTYRWTSWTEFGDELFEVPCTLTILGERMVFDFEGAAPQTPHFFNSKDYIIKSSIGVSLAGLLARDLPYNDGILASFEVRCPDASIVNSKPPAPIGAAHMHVGCNAASVAMTTLHLAIAASPDAPERKNVAAMGGSSAIGNQMWSWTTPDGAVDAFFGVDGNWVGSPAGLDHDGLDLSISATDEGSAGHFVDIEVLESWFPLLYLERRARPGPGGAGRSRSGGGTVFAFRPHEIPMMNGTLFGMRRWMPLQGLAGGRPGACTEFVVHRADGTSEVLDVNRSGVVVGADDWYEMRIPSGGGFGDPLDRDPVLVAQDVATGRLTREEAASHYGVHLDEEGMPDHEASERARDAVRQERLARAAPAPRPLDPDAVDQGAGPELPLYPGVVQRGSVACAEISGAPLARAPHHWTDGCPVVTEDLWGDEGPAIDVRSYLDPRTGRALHVEVVPRGAPLSFLMNPTHWSSASDEVPA